MAMDVKRDPAILKRKKIRQGIILGLVAVGVIAITAAVMRLEPAAPGVSGSTLWFGTVQRGPMVRSVNGAGTLVPEDVRIIPATTTARVERIVLRPGAQVVPGTLIAVLTNPDLQNTFQSAELTLRTSVANLENQRATMLDNRLLLENQVEDAKSSRDVALSQLEANRVLAEQGIVPELQIRTLEAGLQQAQNRLSLAEKQLQTAKDTETTRLAPQQAAVDRDQAALDRAREQVADLQVRSNMTGVLQSITLEVGQTVGAGSELARVNDPTNLKAVVRISETQTRDLSIGLPAVIDTRNGKVAGHVTRIDPASTGGTVGVDVTLDEPLPTGARAAMSVDGTIELERLADVLFVESPAFGQENSSIGLYKLTPDGHAVRTTVRLGRRSVQFVEVVEGLEVNDRVILSDMSTYDAFDRVRITN